MPRRLRQQRFVMLTCVVVVVMYSVVESLVTAASEWEMTSMDNESYSNNESLITQTTTELLKTLRYDDTEPLKKTITRNFEILYSNSYIYLWDKTKLSSSEYQESFCPYRCKHGKLKTLKERNRYCTDVICFPCSCQKPACQIYGICCPDISVPYLSPPNKVLYSTSTTGQISFSGDINKVNVLDENDLFKFGNFAAHNSSGLQADNEHARNPENFHFKTTKDSEFLASTDIKARPKLECQENIMCIRSCHADVKVSGEVIQKCESNIPEEEVSFDTVALVTDNQTNVVYCNQYCAECNGVKQKHKWGIEVKCRTFMRVYTARSLDEFLRQALNTKPDCSIQQTGPEDLETVSCQGEWFNSPVVDTCNATGLWHEYDDDVAVACASMTSQAFMVSSMVSTTQTGNYKNIFCAICNKDYPTFSSCPDVNKGDAAQPPPVPMGSPYSILFNLGDKPTTTDGNGIHRACNSTDWASPDGSCIPVHCSPGKNLIDGNCTTAVTQIAGLGYRLQLWFFPEVDNITETRFTIDAPLSQYTLDSFHFMLYGYLFPALDYAQLSYGVLLNTSTMEAFHETDSTTLKSTSSVYNSAITPDFNPSVNTLSTSTEKIEGYHFRVPYLYWITSDIIASRHIPRDAFEQTILDELFSKEFRVNYSDRVSINFRPVLMWHDFDITIYCSNIAKNDTHIKCFHDQLYQDYSYLEHQFYEVFDLFLNFTKTLTCTYVSFQRSQYIIETTYQDLLPVVTVKLNFSTTQLTITNDSDLSKMSVDASGELNVCCDVLDQQIALLPGVGKEPGLRQNVQYVLSLVCMGVSITCLLLTVVTYARFSVLRSVAGRNTLCLCLSLLLAQVSLLASFFTDVKSPLCAPLGMLTHFCWLSLFSWNFICCFYMYNVFAKMRNSQLDPRSQNLTLIKNVAFTLLTPAIIVSVVVVGVYVTSGGSSLGYGGSVCYLNARILVGAATIGPVVLITITNIIFFLKTVYNIHGVGRLQKCETSKKDDRNNLYIYVKLSTMTGAFWLTFIVAEVSDLDGLRILAIILNGLQGLFIFMSYICNKRVLVLYLPHLRPHTNITTRTSSLATSVPKASQRSEKHELQHTQSELSVSSEPAGSSVCSTDNILVQHASSLDQVADDNVPKK